jgi:hypothetical protein
MLKGIFSVYYLIFKNILHLFFTHMQGIGKPPWSLWLNLYLKFTTRLRDLTVCERYRNGVVIQSPCNLLCDLLSTLLLLNLFRLAITKGLNTY